MIKKLFVSDLDGTLFYYNNKNTFEINENNLKAIHSFIEKGNIFAIATARPIKFRDELSRMLGFDLDFICNNGAVTITSNNKIFEKHITLKDYMEIDRFLLENNINGVVSTYVENISYISNKKLYPFNDSKASKERIQILKGIDTSKLNLYQNIKCYKLLLMIHPTEVEDTKNKLRLIYSDKYEIVSSDIDNIDIVSKGCTKGSGIEILMEYYGISKKNSAAIGDAENDISMYRVVDKSYAMMNGSELVKKEAKITVNSVEEAITGFMSCN